MNNNKIWVWGLLVLIVINVSALITIGANTWMFNRDKKPRTERISFGDRSPFGGMKEKLHLSEDQNKAYAAFQMKSRSEMRGSFKEMREYRDRLNEEFSREYLDLEEIDRINIKIIEIDKNIRNQGTQIQVELREILNDDQVKILIEEMKRHHGRRRSGRHPMGYNDGIKSIGRLGII